MSIVPRTLKVPALGWHRGRLTSNSEVESPESLAGQKSAWGPCALIQKMKFESPRSPFPDRVSGFYSEGLQSQERFDEIARVRYRLVLRYTCFPPEVLSWDPSDPLVHLVHDSMTSYNNPTFLIFLKAKPDAVDQIENVIQIDLRTDDKSSSNTSHFLRRRR